MVTGSGRVWFEGWVVPSMWDGPGLVYGGARVGVGLVGCGFGVADAVVSAHAPAGSAVAEGSCQSRCSQSLHSSGGSR